MDSWYVFTYPIRIIGEGYFIMRSKMGNILKRVISATLASVIVVSTPLSTLNAYATPQTYVERVNKGEKPGKDEKAEFIATKGSYLKKAFDKVKVDNLKYSNVVQRFNGLYTTASGSSFVKKMKSIKEKVSETSITGNDANKKKDAKQHALADKRKR